MNNAQFCTSVAGLVALVGLVGFGCSSPQQVDDAREMGDQTGTPGGPDTPDEPGAPDWDLHFNGSDNPDLPIHGMPGTPDAPEETACGVSTVTELLVGKTDLAGTVTIENDDTSLCVILETNEGYYLSATHIDLQLEVPAGNPSPGQFLDTQSFDPAVASYTVCFSLAAFGYEPGMDIFVGAHAGIVRLVDGVVMIPDGSGWGHGEPTSGSNWAQYVMHTIQECTP